eukprot:jgi/Bigna1/85189/estExt_fgenesh1_pg.C_20395
MSIIPRRAMHDFERNTRYLVPPGGHEESPLSLIEGRNDGCKTLLFKTRRQLQNRVKVITTTTTRAVGICLGDCSHNKERRREAGPGRSDILCLRRSECIVASRNREDFSRYQRRWFGVKGKIPKKDGYSAAACDSSGVRRAYVWSHHIYAKKKKREIPELAKKLSLSGFCSTGKPGFIIVEGAEPDVKRFLSTVKRWPWQRKIHRLIVRVQENADERAFPNFQMTGAGGGEKNDLREVRKLMDNAGVGEHFEAVAGINEIKSG